MKKSVLGKWLFIYYFSISCVFGFFLIIFGKSVLKIDDPAGVFAILVPTLISQVAIIMKWFVDKANERDTKADYVVRIPVFLVKVPLIVVTAILVLGTVLKIVGFHQDADWTPSDQQFKWMVTFCISLLNATSIYLVSAFFSKKG